MLGSLIWRCREALAVLFGRKKTIDITKKRSGVTRLEDLSKPVASSFELQKFINELDIEFLFCEFGETRVNAGGNEMPESSRLNPSLYTLRHFFPKAKFTVYSDFDLQEPGVNLVNVTSPIPEKEHPRYLYRTADYFKFKSLLNSTADFKCVVDTDMFAVSPEIYTLPYLTKLFGFCAPSNPRNLMKNDMAISLDSGEIPDMSRGFGHSYNQSPMTLWKQHSEGHAFYEKCCEIMIKEPSRASLVMWKAAQSTGYFPYLLSPEFCVCVGQEGIGNEVLLHVGHKSVAKYYNVIV